MSSDDLGPREKWLNKLVVISDDQAQKESLRVIFSDPLPDMLRVEDLEKTLDESRLIAEVMEMVRLFAVNLGLEPIQISEGRIHIIKREEYTEKLKSAEYGSSTLGHAYIPRQPDMTLFVHVLAHELAHLISYTELRVDVGRVHDDWINTITVPRLGLVDMRSEPHRFDGLNEGVTEMVCMVILGGLANTTEFFDDVEKKQLTSWAGYFILFMLVDALLDLVVERKGCERRVVETLLLNDFMTGTDTFLVSLEEVLPGATEILAKMDKTQEGGLWAIHRLGLHELWDTLSDWLIEQDNDTE